MSPMKMSWVTLDRICEQERFGQQAMELRRQPPPVSVSRRLEFADEDDETATVRARPMPRRASSAPRPRAAFR